MCELTGQVLYQSFAAVVVRGGCSSIDTLMPYGGSLFSVTSESAGDSDCGAHDAVIRVRTRLQVNRDVSDKLGVWLSRDDVVGMCPIRRPGTVECTRRASLRNGEERVDKGKLVVARAFLPCAPIILEPFCPVRTPIQALASLKMNR